VLVADARGRVLLANGAFDRLWGAPTPRTLDELPPRLAGPEEARRGLRDLVEHGRAWRGEVRLTGGGAGDRPLLVRADPVFSSPGRALGLVLLLTDITEQRAAEAARRRFQEGVIERHRFMAVPLDSGADLTYRNLLTAVVGNAQLAALEITDGVDLARMPGMLESVQASVTRTAELLEHLVWHASRGSDEEAD